jgi:hypothetical protein
MSAIALLAVARRTWKPALYALLAIAVASLWLALKSEQRHAAKLGKQLASANAMIDLQNAKVDALAAEGSRRQAEGKAALAGALRVNARQASQAKRLSASAHMPRAAGEPCTISETLRTTPGL